MTIYKVVCYDCDREWIFDDDSHPDYANPAKNRFLPGDSIKDADWDGKSAALGKRDGHQADVTTMLPYERHEMEITKERND